MRTRNVPESLLSHARGVAVVTPTIAATRGSHRSVRASFSGARAKVVMVANLSKRSFELQARIGFPASALGRQPSHFSRHSRPAPASQQFVRLRSHFVQATPDTTLRPRSPRGRATRSPQGEAWWARQDSNLQPDRYERPALTIELQAPPRDGRESARPATVRGSFTGTEAGVQCWLRRLETPARQGLRFLNNRNWR